MMSVSSSAKNSFSHSEPASAGEESAVGGPATGFLAGASMTRWFNRGSQPSQTSCSNSKLELADRCSSPECYFGGTFTRHAARRNRHAINKGMGRKSRLSGAASPEMTFDIPATIPNTYSTPKKISHRRRYLASRSARSTARAALHIIHARSAVKARTPTITDATAAGDIESEVVASRLTDSFRQIDLGFYMFCALTILPRPLGWIVASTKKTDFVIPNRLQPVRNLLLAARQQIPRGMNPTRNDKVMFRKDVNNTGRLLAEITTSRYTTLAWGLLCIHSAYCSS
jgi:hypothetical protein